MKFSCVCHFHSGNIEIVSNGIIVIEKYGTLLLSLHRPAWSRDDTPNFSSRTHCHIAKCHFAEYGEARKQNELLVLPFGEMTNRRLTFSELAFGKMTFGETPGSLTAGLYMQASGNTHFFFFPPNTYFTPIITKCELHTYGQYIYVRLQVD